MVTDSIYAGVGTAASRIAPSTGGERMGRVILPTDTHMHTRFSADSMAPVHVMAETAIAKGLAYICFTDHIDYDLNDPVDHLIFELPLEEYFTRMKAAQAAYAGRIHIGIGVELGMQTHVCGRNEETAKNWPFDYVIASMHLVKGMDPYYENIWKAYSQEEVYRSYFEETLENVRLFENFDCLGHLDYASRYGVAYAKKYGLEQIYKPERYMELIDEILKVLIRKDKALECNSGNLKTGSDMTNPGVKVLKRYLELGGEMICIGADAHKPEHIAYGYDRVLEILQAAGVGEITYFQGRKPKCFPIR